MVVQVREDRGPTGPRRRAGPPRARGTAAERVGARRGTRAGHALPLPDLRIESVQLRLRQGRHAVKTGSPGILPGFQETSPFSGLTEPTDIRFAPDGRVFVAEKSGLIKVFDGLGDPTPTMFADLRTKVHNFWDRGLLGLALDPDFPATAVRLRPLHPRRAIGGTAPRWGTPGATYDGCPNPPGATTTAAWSAAGSRG